MQAYPCLPKYDEPHLKEALAQLNGGHLDEANQEFYRLIASEADPLRQAAIGLEAGTRIQFAYGSAGEAVRYFEGALDDCPDRRSLLRVAVELQRGTCYLFTPRAEEGSRIIRAAARRAVAEGDPGLQSIAALAEAEALAHEGYTEEAIQKDEFAANLALKLAKVALKLQDRHLGSFARQLGARALHRASTHSMTLGRLNNAIELAGRALEQAELGRDHLQITRIRNLTQLLYWKQGRWDDVRTEGTAVRSVMAPLHELPPEAFYPLALRLADRGWTGTDEALEEALAELHELKLPNPAFEPGRWILMVKGRALQRNYDDAKGILRHHARSIKAHPDPGQFDAWIMEAVHLLSCCCDVGDVAGARKWYDRLIGFADDPVVVPLTFTALELGRAASLIGRYDEAFDLLARVLVIMEREQALPFLAFTVYELGLTHKRRGQTNDLVKARHYFEEAARRFDDLDMHRHAAKAGRRLDEIRRRRSKEEPTPRQAEALGLQLIERRSRQEIAQAMGISVKTVDGHLGEGRIRLCAKGLDSDEAQIEWLRRNWAGKNR